MNEKLVSIVLFVMIVSSTPLFAETTNEQRNLSAGIEKVDTRVLRALKEADIRFTIIDSGDIVVTYGIGEGDVQMVFINSDTQMYGKLEIREIWAVAYRSEKQFSEASVRSLLERNCVIKIGAWSTLRGSTDNSIMFSIKTDADLKATSLAEMLEFVAITASGLRTEFQKTEGKIWSPSNEKEKSEKERLGLKKTVL